MVDQVSRKDSDVEMTDSDSEMDLMEVEKRAKRKRGLRRKSSSLPEKEEDSASLDSMAGARNREQLLGLIDDALKGDRKSLERLLEERVDSTISETCSSLPNEAALELYLLIVKLHKKPVFSTFKWLRHLISSKTDVLLSSSSVQQESRQMEELLTQRTTLSDQCLRLRGKLDLIMSSCSK